MLFFLNRAILTPHSVYESLDSTVEERGYHYRELFKTQLENKDIHLIREAAHYCQPLGDERFKKSIERQLGVRLGYAKRGRPLKVTPEIG